MLANVTRSLIAAGLMCAVSSAAHAVQCEPPGGFDTWLTSFKQEAAAKGISQQAIATALNGVTYDPNIVARDRGQGVFRQSFEEFSGRMVPPRLNKGANMMRQYAGTLTRIEQQFGVPGPVLVAIWGLETDFGVNVGKFPTIRALASLAYDCRRTDMFQGELLDALRLVERGDLTPAEMHGAWAGEIGQTQFMPSSYIKFAIDYDGNGRSDLIRSPADVLASTANFLKSYGWQRGQPWGPGSANFDVLLQWNRSQVYSKTVAYFAQRLDQSVQ
jgi:lytic murein transglycosylase